MADALNMDKLVERAAKLSGSLSKEIASSGTTGKKIHEVSQQIGQLRARKERLAKLDIQLAKLDRSRSMVQRAEAAGAPRAEMNRLNASYATQLAIVGKLEARLNQMGWDKATESSASMDAKIQGTKNYRETLKSLHQDQKKIEAQQATLDQNYQARMGRLSQWGKAAELGMKIGTKLGKTMLSPANEFMKHEDAMMDVRIHVPGASDAQGQPTDIYRQAEREIQAMSGRVPLETTQLAALYGAAARMQLPTNQLAGFTEWSTQVAQALQLAPAAAVQSMGGLVKSLKLPMSEIQAMADAVNYLEDTTGASSSDLLGYLNSVGDAASSVGISGQNLVALGNTLMSGGMSKEAAGSSVSSLLTTLGSGANTSKPFNTAVAKVGMTPQQLQEGMKTDAVDTLLKLSDAVNQLPSGERADVLNGLVGPEHAKQLEMLVGRTAELRQQMALVNSVEAKGSVAREAAARNSALSAQLQVTKSLFFNALATAGEPLKDVLVPVLGMINSVLQVLTQWMQSYPGLVKGIMWLVGGLGVAIVMFSALASAVVAVMGPLLTLRYLMASRSLGQGAKSVGDAVANAAAGMGGGAGGRSGAGARKGGLGRMAGLGRKAGPLSAMIGVGMSMMAPGAAAAGSTAKVAAGAGAGAGALKGLGGAFAAAGSGAGGFFSLLAGGGRIISMFARTNPMAATLTGLYGAFEGVSARWQDIVGYFDAGEWLKMGGAIWEGLEVGLDAATNGLYSGVKGAVGGLWDKAKSLWPWGGGHADDSSEPAGALATDKAPGRKAATAMAVAAGVSMSPMAVAGAPEVSAAMPVAAIHAPAATPIAAKASPGMAMATAGGTYNITIHAAPGMDEQAVARAVAMELDRRDRAQASRRLSTLGDID